MRLPSEGRIRIRFSSEMSIQFLMSIFKIVDSVSRPSQTGSKTLMLRSVAPKFDSLSSRSDPGPFSYLLKSEIRSQLLIRFFFSMFRTQSV